MKTLLFTLEYPPFFGGVAKVYGRVAKHWPDSGRIVVLDNSDGRLINAGWPLLRWAPSVKRLNDKIKRHKIDHVIVGHILPLGTAAYLLSIFKSIDFSVFLHGMDLACALKTPRKKFLAGLILSKARSIICLNSYTQELLISSFGRSVSSKSAVVNPGVDGEIPSINDDERQLFAASHGFENKIVLFSVARLVMRKGIDRVIEAMPEIVQSDPRVHFYFAGSGPDEEYLDKKINALPARYRKNIIKLGKISEKDKWLRLLSCDIFIMPSRNIGSDFEGFGIVYLEANLAGKPVIAGRSGGVADAVKDGLNGIMVDPEDPRKIAAAVLRLSGDPELRRRLGEDGRKRARQEFRWDEQVGKIYEFISRQS